MIREDLKNADEGVLELIVDQAEKRLAAQCDFADAQDQRGTSLVNAAAALGAAAVALAGGSFATLGLSTPLTIGGLFAMMVFTLAACVGLWALRSEGFHSCGYYPADFIADIHSDRSIHDLREDFALDLQFRLTENKKVLHKRGHLIDVAALAMVCTPIVAAVAAYVLA